MIRKRFLPLIALIARPLPSGDGEPADAEKTARTLQKELEKKNGDAIALAGDLLEENRKYREKNAAYKTEITDLKAKAPGEGVTVLTAEQKKQWDAYQAAGTPEQIAAITKERDGLKVENGTLKETTAKNERATLLRDVAEAAGYKASVLTDRDALTPGLSYEIKDVVEDGKTVKRAFVKFKDGEGESAPLIEKPLGEFAALKWPDYLPALQATGDSAGTGGQGSTGKTKFVPQGSGGTSQKENVFEKTRREAEEKKKAVAPIGPSLEERLNMRPVGTAPATS